MKVWVLAEDTTTNECLQPEHGLSLYIEANGYKILFDMGCGELFAHNAKKMGVDLSAVDFAVVSHGHNDHGGGLATFLDVNDHAFAYINENAFEPHYNKRLKYNGLDVNLKQHERVRLISDYCHIAQGFELFTYADLPASHEIMASGQLMVVGDQHVPDDFRHEQFMMITENEVKYLFSGCSHKGILNIAQWAKPSVLVGGFHCTSFKPGTEEGEAFFRHASEELLSHNCTYYTCHCTGEGQYSQLKSLMQDKLYYLATGDIVQF